jgi:hypothetical protein
MGNVVVNTIVRMFSRKAVGKAMKSAKKSMGAKKGQAGRWPQGASQEDGRQEQEGHRLGGPRVPEKEARARRAEEE